MHKTTGKAGENRGALPALTFKSGDNRGEPWATAANHAKSRKTLKVAQTSGNIYLTNSVGTLKTAKTTEHRQTCISHAQTLLKAQNAFHKCASCFQKM